MTSCVTNDVRLAWALDNARDTEFEVEIVDSSGKRVLKEKTQALEFPLPDDARLEPGQRYTWAVMARERGLPQPLYAIGEFRVADAATRRRDRERTAQGGCAVLGARAVRRAPRGHRREERRRRSSAARLPPSGRLGGRAASRAGEGDGE